MANHKRNRETEVFTVGEAASRLRVGAGCTYRLIKAGKLKAVRVGRLLRVPQQALAEFLSAGLPH
jgi:excisionase family DNA binding protein